MSGEYKKYNVTVLSRDETTTYPEVGKAVTIVLITYIAAGLPPHTVRIPKDRWNTEAEKAAIRASIEERLKMKPISYRV